MSSSLEARQKFLELKFDGNRRLAQEFVYIQDPSVTQLQKWQVWKKEAEAENRWTSWQTEDRAKAAARIEPFKDPHLPRRKKRHRRRVTGNDPFDIKREVELVESTEKMTYEERVKYEQTTAMLKGLPPPELPPPPPNLLEFVISEGVQKKYHRLEPPDKDFYEEPSPFQSHVITKQPGKLSVEESLSIKRRKALGVYKEESLKPSNAMYRFKIWWFGYFAAVNCQRIVRGYFARRWVHLRIYEIRALKRRRAVYIIQRVYRGHVGRLAFKLRFITLTSAALFIQRAYQHWAHNRERSIHVRRNKAASKIQRSWYKLNSMLLGHRLLSLVKNRKQALSAKDGFVAMYWGALKLQVIIKKFFARKRYRRMKALELSSCIRLQAWGRALLVRKHVSTSLAAKIDKLHDHREHAAFVLRRFFKSRLIGIRVRKEKRKRNKAATVLQALTRGRISRKLDTRLKKQAALVRDWLTSFKQERVTELMNAKESKNFYLQVESNFSTKKKVIRHKKTNVSDLPKAIREGPLFDHNAIPDYAALAHAKSQHQSQHQSHHQSHQQHHGSQHSVGTLGSELESLAEESDSQISGGDGHSQSHSHAASLISGGSSHFERKRHTVGVIIEPTSKEHINMLRLQAQQVKPVNASTLRHAGSLDMVLEKRHRTVSRGRPRDEGIAKIWDATIELPDNFDGNDMMENKGNYGMEDGLTNNNVLDKNEDLVMSRSQSAGNVSNSVGRTSRQRRQQQQNTDTPPSQKSSRDFGAVRIEIDKGTCVYKGNPKSKALDIQSKRLVEAEDRLAYRGVANFPNNHRRMRQQGDAIIMADALDLIAQESVERGYI